MAVSVKDVMVDDGCKVEVTEPFRTLYLSTTLHSIVSWKGCLESIRTSYKFISVDALNCLAGCDAA
jgi:hypothetical protein